MSEEIFISYSSKDSTIVEQIVELFKSNNISYWFAPEKLTVGTHSIWPPHAFTLGHLTHNDLAS